MTDNWALPAVELDSKLDAVARLWSEPKELEKEWRVITSPSLPVVPAVL